MRTKNFFSIAALIICGLVCVNSIKAEGTSDDVILNIKFKPVQSITVTAAQKPVDLEYYALADYRDGVSKTLTDHLTVFSTGGFVVSVSTTEANFVRSAGGTIPVGDVIVTAADGSTSATNPSFTPVDVTLSTTATPLITTTAGGNEIKYNITYDNTAAGGTYNYINKYRHDDATSVYTATVTYTIATN